MRLCSLFRKEPLKQFLVASTGESAQLICCGAAQLAPASSKGAPFEWQQRAIFSVLKLETTLLNH